MNSVHLMGWGYVELSPPTGKRMPQPAGAGGEGSEPQNVNGGLSLGAALMGSS